MGDDVRGDGLVYHGRQNVRCVFDGGDFVRVDGEDSPGEFGAGLEGRGEVRLPVPEGVHGFEFEGQVRQGRDPHRGGDAFDRGELVEDGRVDDRFRVLHVRGAEEGPVVVEECEDQRGVRV